MHRCHIFNDFQSIQGYFYFKTNKFCLQTLNFLVKSIINALFLCKITFFNIFKKKKTNNLNIESE